MANQNDAKQGDSTTTASTTESGHIKLHIRTARVQKYVTVEENISIKNLRQKVADTFEVEDPVLTVLIFGGKILKDHEDIQTHSIKDGQTIHLVIRNKPTTDTPTNNTTTTSRQTNASNYTNDNANNNNNNDNNINNNNPLLNNPLLGGNLGDVQQRLQQMLLSNPETMQNMINPMMQQMMANPDNMRSLFGSMQRMQMLMDQNPEVNHLLSNPDVLRESLEMVRNPAALQEVMRNYDRALNNMESMPGGYNVLRRMYTEFQEPLLSAFQEQFTPENNNTSTTGNTNTSTTAEQQRTENRDPLPNPWATPTPTSDSHTNGLGGFPGADLLGALGGLGGLGGAGGGGGAGGAGAGGLAGLAGLAGLGGLGGLGGGLGGAGMPAGGRNRDNSSQDDTNTGEILRSAATMLQDQEFLSLMTNPEAIQSVEQIRQGFERLQRISPGLFGRLDFPTLPGLGNLTNSTTNSNQAPGTQTNTPSSPRPAPTTTETSANTTTATSHVSNDPSDQPTNNSALFGNLGDIQQRLQHLLISNPDAMQNMVNPMMQQLMSSPEAIQSMEQIRQGFERLQRIAPGLFGRLGLPNFPM